MTPESPHVNCTAHSGLNLKSNIQVILSVVAVAMLTASLGILIEIKAGVSAGAVAIQYNRDNIYKLETRMAIIEKECQKK